MGHRTRALIAATALASAGSAMAQGVFSHDGPFTQARSGAVFPEALAGFRRINMVQYDAAGHDVSATYQAEGDRGSIVLTTYVYPAPPARGDAEREALCSQEFDGAVASLRARFAEARPLERGTAPATHEVSPDLSHRASFALGTDQDGKPGASVSEVRLYCHVAGGDWQVKYRLTAPEGTDVSGVQAFIDAGPWPSLKRA